MARTSVLICTMAWLAISGVPAPAQYTSNPNVSGGQTRCWDAASNQIRSVTDGAVGPRGGRSLPPPVGTPSGKLGHIPISPNAPGGIATRPPEAASLPNC